MGAGGGRAVHRPPRGNSGALRTAARRRAGPHAASLGLTAPRTPRMSPGWDRVVHVFEVDRLIATSRELARWQAQLMADMVALADATPVPEFAAMEIASALAWTRQAATTHLAL